MAALASLLAFAASSKEDVDGHLAARVAAGGDFLSENTLAYPDELGKENLIHFGRFGNFDWYFPCQFESGYWKLDEDQVLHLTYDNPEFKARQYKLAGLADGLELVEPDRGTTTTGKLLAGNRMPFF